MNALQKTEFKNLVMMVQEDQGKTFMHTRLPDEKQVGIFVTKRFPQLQFSLA